MATLILVEDLAGPASMGRGGHAMYVLQWLHSLERLGHQVFFLEYVKDVSAAAIEHFQRLIERWWHPGQAALVRDTPLTSVYGPDFREIQHQANRAAAVLTLAAHYRREPWPLLEKVRPRILIEQDPAYTHLWAAGGDPAEVYGQQDLYFTVGLNISSARCAVPTLGIRWRPICNPVVLDWWPAASPPPCARFTTVADWRSYGYLEFECQVLGPKAEEFRNVLHLPRQVSAELEIALQIDAEDPDLNCLREHGWRIESPDMVATPERYRTYIGTSLGEFSCAKGGYVGTRCGWFSDRSACYLAAGRPVVLQATGFEDHLPTGAGLFAFQTIEEATLALEAIRADYARHSAAARAIAQEYLAGERTVRRLLTEAEITGD